MSSKITKVLAFDSETSGINYTAYLPCTGRQMVSVGMIAATVPDFKPIESLYLEIKWNKRSQWDWQAEKTHGLTRSYLEEHGMDEDEAAQKIALFLDKHFGINNPISLLGQNVVEFDLPFLKELLWSRDLKFRFPHRHFDCFALSMGTVGAYDSNQLGEYLGMTDRGKHNALEDAERSLAAFRIIRKRWDNHVAVG